MAICFEKRLQAFRCVVFERQGRRAPPGLLHNVIREEGLLERVPVCLRFSQSSPARLKRIVPCSVVASLAFRSQKNFFLAWCSTCGADGLAVCLDTLPNRNLDLRNKDVTVEPPDGFRCVRSLKEQTECFDQVRSRLFNRLLIARDIELRT